MFRIFTYSPFSLKSLQLGLNPFHRNNSCRICDNGHVAKSRSPRSGFILSQMTSPSLRNTFIYVALMIPSPHGSLPALHVLAVPFHLPSFLILERLWAPLLALLLSLAATPGGIVLNTVYMLTIPKFFLSSLYSLLNFPDLYIQLPSEHL